MTQYAYQERSAFSEVGILESKDSTGFMQLVVQTDFGAIEEQEDGSIPILTGLDPQFSKIVHTEHMWSSKGPKIDVASPKAFLHHLAPEKRCLSGLKGQQPLSPRQVACSRLHAHKSGVTQAI